MLPSSCHSWVSDRLSAAEMVAASSYHNDGPLAPARLTAAASSATITASSATGLSGKRSKRPASPWRPLPDCPVYAAWLTSVTYMIQRVAGPDAHEMAG